MLKKKCAKCGIEKIHDEFKPHKRGCSYGLYSRCKSCDAEDREKYNATKRKERLEQKALLDSERKREEALFEMLHPNKLKCSECNTIKHKSEFYKSKASKTGYNTRCTTCVLEKQRAVTAAKRTPEQIAEKARKVEEAAKKKKERIEYYESRAIYKTTPYKICRECGVEKNISKFPKKKHGGKGVASRCIPCYKAYCKRSKDRNADQNKRYRRKPSVREARNKRERERRKTEPLYKFKRTIRTRMADAFRASSWNKNGSSEKLLGCSFSECMDHIESQFKEGMTWQNHGEWHIDHIIPLDSAKTEDEVLELFKYTNLQPLWASENWSKGTKEA